MYMTKIDDSTYPRIMWTIRQHYLKIIMYALHISKEVISKEIELNTFLQCEIDVQQIHSSDNLADLFTKSLLTSTFKKLIYKIGMRQLKDVDMRGSMLIT